MGWTAEGVTVTADWHVFADGRWSVEPVPVSAPPPVNVFVTESRMAPVEYRHQAGTCPGTCVQSCGHALAYGCDCDTIAAEADAQD